MKSLLQLLKDEDKAFKEHEARKQGFDNLAKNNVSPAMILEFKRLVDDEKKRLDKARKEIREYFSVISRSEERRQESKEAKQYKIESFMWLLANEAERNEFVERCKRWGISEEEMFECIDYMADMFGVQIW